VVTYVMPRSERNDLEKEVTGEYNTFRVYLLMLKLKKSSAREVQKALVFSSTWLATHHLEKLERLGLMRKNCYGDHHVVRKNFGILRFFYSLTSFPELRLTSSRSSPVRAQSPIN